MGALLRADRGRKVANEDLVVGKLTCLPPTVVPPVAGFDPLALPLIPTPKLETDLPVVAYV
jgi:hypothetical protein